MKWTTLKTLLNGMIGNSLFLISLLSVFSVIPLSSIFLNNKILSLSIIGAVLLSISFVLMKIYLPAEIDNHNNIYSYYNYFLSLQKNKSLDYSLEFTCLEDNSDLVKKLPIYDDQFLKIDTFCKIDSFKEKLGEERALLSMVFFKFNLMDTSNHDIRGLITYLFIIGTALFYLGPFLRISSIIIRSFS